MNRLNLPCTTLALLLACGGKEPADTGTSPTAAVDCSLLAAEAPSPRGEAAGAWDAARRRLVLFGGDQGVPINCASQTDFTSETWIYWADCDAFQQLEVEGPSRRGRHLAATDGQALYVHGGRTRAGTEGTYTVKKDFWKLDFATDTWSELPSDGGPSARSTHAGAVVGDELVIFGGNTSDDGLVFSPLGDLWAFDLRTEAWREIPTSGGPSDRLFHAAASDGRYLYVYGGGDENAFLGPFFGDLWRVDPASGAWEQLHDGSGTAPRARIWPNLVWDPAQERLLLWAGHDDGNLGNRNDLWAFSPADGAWEKLRHGDREDQPANGFCDFPVDFTELDLESPERRQAAVAGLDADGRLWTFGGKTDCGLVNDVWSWTEADGRWTQHLRSTSGESCPRAFADCSTLCF